MPPGTNLVTATCVHHGALFIEVEGKWYRTLVCPMLTPEVINLPQKTAPTLPQKPKENTEVFLKLDKEALAVLMQDKNSKEKLQEELGDTKKLFAFCIGLALGGLFVFLFT